MIRSNKSKKEMLQMNKYDDLSQNPIYEFK